MPSAPKQFQEVVARLHSHFTLPFNPRSIATHAVAANAMGVAPAAIPPAVVAHARIGPGGL